jgi:hypothetical protein
LAYTQLKLQIFVTCTGYISVTFNPCSLVGQVLLFHNHFGPFFKEYL